MDSLILVCEYDGAADRASLQRLADCLLRPAVPWPGKLQWEKERQHILAWLLLERAVRDRFGCTLSQLAIARSDQGRPYSPAHPEVQFNLSHCARACACIVGTAPVGIDVERKFQYRDGLERKICHPDETDRLARMGRREREAQLPFLWTLKESCVKMDGRGLGYGMDRVSFAPLLPVGLTKGERLRATCGAAEVLLMDEGDYVLAACGESRPCAQAGGPPEDGREVRFVTERELCRER